MYNSVAGTVVEAVGDLTNSDSLKQSGIERHVHADDEYCAAHEQGGHGLLDKFQGKLDTVTGTITGYEDKHAQG